MFGNSPFRMAAPSYPPEMTKPMEEELTRLGVEALHTPEDVEKALENKDQTVLVVVNSVCGCAAGQARPGVALASANAKRPDKMVTVFAGVDREATAQARSRFKGYAPSSPQMALLKGGEVVFMLERHHVENSSADMIAKALKKAFDEHC
jgi:putative YphP/YqiW family bacilliredoxin